jgi:hypothetical protein
MHVVHHRSSISLGIVECGLYEVDVKEEDDDDDTDDRHVFSDVEEEQDDESDDGFDVNRLST